jgi:hypothetical protein
MVKRIAIAAALAGACTTVQPPPPVYVHAESSASINASGDDTSDTQETGSEPQLSPSERAVIVLADKHVNRPTEVLGVFDFHTAETSEDKGFDELRRRAAAMGADAVIGAEFEHGDDGGPSHLSGMAVRFLDH